MVWPGYTSLPATPPTTRARAHPFTHPRTHAQREREREREPFLLMNVRSKHSSQLVLYFLNFHISPSSKFQPMLTVIVTKQPHRVPQQALQLVIQQKSRADVPSSYATEIFNICTKVHNFKRKLPSEHYAVVLTHGSKQLANVCQGEKFVVNNNICHVTEEDR